MVYLNSFSNLAKNVTEILQEITHMLITFVKIPLVRWPELFFFLMQIENC